MVIEKEYSRLDKEICKKIIKILTCVDCRYNI